MLSLAIIQKCFLNVFGVPFWVAIVGGGCRKVVKLNYRTKTFHL